MYFMISRRRLAAMSGDEQRTVRGRGRNNYDSARKNYDYGRGRGRDQSWRRHRPHADRRSPHRHRLVTRGVLF